MCVILYGLSGCGKSTLCEGLSQSPAFSPCKMSVTRPPREDDSPDLFEYLDIATYQSNRRQGAFVFDADDGKRYYGYKWTHLQDGTKCINLLFGCPPFAFMNPSFVCTHVLIEGEADKGLACRGNVAIARTRKSVNQDLQKRFFGQQTFRRKMDLIITNSFFEGPNAWRKIQTWIQIQKFRIFFKHQTKRALQERKVEPAVWIAYCYSTVCSKSAFFAARWWGCLALQLGWADPLLSHLTFGGGRPLVSNAQMTVTVLSGSDYQVKVSLLAFLHKQAGGASTKKGKCEVWLSRLNYLYHG
ncbi:MAG: hypothetical protein S4CHLAM2_13230 [Chlamydiales bacterium]|nr:hypothetical protein [Chlamydiales bacterium]